MLGKIKSNIQKPVEITIISTISFLFQILILQKVQNQIKSTIIQFIVSSIVNNNLIYLLRLNWINSKKITKFKTFLMESFLISYTVINILMDCFTHTKLYNKNYYKFLVNYTECHVNHFSSNWPKHGEIVHYMTAIQQDVLIWFFRQGINNVFQIVNMVEIVCVFQYILDLMDNVEYVVYALHFRLSILVWREIHYYWKYPDASSLKWKIEVFWPRSRRFWPKVSSYSASIFGRKWPISSSFPL